ncbi:MAG: PAS domain S-box protein, partial [Nitrospiraceae bacterium]
MAPRERRVHDPVRLADRNDVNELREFFLDAPVGFHCLRPDGVIVWANQADLNMLGYRPEEYIGRHISEFHADQQTIRDLLDRLTRGETLQNYEAVLRCKDGSAKHVLISSHGLWEEGRLTSTRCFTLDITSRKLAEDQFREVQAKYRALLESTGEGIVGLDIHGRCIFINQAAARMLQYRSDEILGKQLHWIVHHSRADGLAYPYEDCSICRAYKTATAYRIEDELLWRRDGTSFPVDYSSYPIVENGELSGAVVTFTDITDRQRTIQALRESEEQFRQLAEHIHEAFWMSNPGRDHVLYISPAYEEIWGRSCKSLYESPSSWIESVHPDDRERVLAEALSKQVSGEYDAEYRIVRPDGSIRWIHDRAFPIRDKSGMVYRLAGIAEDITQYKRANEELQRALAQSQAFSSRMESTREEERYRIGQEIHDDLGGVLTYLKVDLTRLGKHIAEMTIGDISEQLQRRIDAMIDVMDGAIKTVQRLSVEMRPVLLDHCGLAAAIIWQAREFEGRTGIRCVFTASPNVEGVNKDQSLLVFRIFQEALTNVARHAYASTVTISLNEDDGQITLAIQDNGHGISERNVSDPQSFGLLGMQERA